ncbi:hypothetical protein [Vibrio fluvialis]|uniref:hypothetical protein n=1 Tax=Vibrio fluvialis TaxID=676 RepID=UPI0015590C57|nr:hypothetical protein [Vibrio fluvialis]
MNVSVGLPAGAVAGDTLTVTGQEPVTLTQAQIDAGTVTFEYDRPADGETLKVDATITDAAGNTSAPGTDSATMVTPPRQRHRRSRSPKIRTTTAPSATPKSMAK